MRMCQKSKQVLQSLRLRKKYPDVVVKDLVYDSKNAINILNLLKSDMLERERHYRKYYCLKEYQ